MAIARDQTPTRPSALRPGWVGLALLAALASSGCVSVVADGADMEVTHYGLVFEGTLPAPDGGTTSAEASFAHRHSAFDATDDIKGEIRATEVRLVARPDTPDLSFIERLEVRMAAEGSTAAQPTVVLDYQRHGGLAGRNVVIPVAESANSMDQWRTRASRYDVTVWGNLPAEDWSIDITVSFTGKFSYDYRP